MEKREKIEQAVKERERVRLDAIPKKWNKREEYEFLRVLTGYGVDLQIGAAVPTPDWQRFKAMAKLDKKSDESLSDYYKVFIAMCKRQAGVRLTEEEKGLEGLIDDISEDHARLVLDRLELLSKLKEVGRVSANDDRLALCQNNSDTPDWWESGKHDKELIRAVLKHGLYRSEQNIFNDPEFSFGQAERQYIEMLEKQWNLAQEAMALEAAATAKAAAAKAEAIKKEQEESIALEESRAKEFETSIEVEVKPDVVEVEKESSADAETEVAAATNATDATDEDNEKNVDSEIETKAETEEESTIGDESRKSVEKETVDESEEGDEKTTECETADKMDETSAIDEPEPIESEPELAEEAKETLAEKSEDDNSIAGSEATAAEKETESPEADVAQSPKSVKSIENDDDKAGETSAADEPKPEQMETDEAVTGEGDDEPEKMDTVESAEQPENDVVPKDLADVNENKDEEAIDGEKSIESPESVDVPKVDEEEKKTDENETKTDEEMSVEKPVDSEDVAKETESEVGKPAESTETETEKMDESVDEPKSIEAEPEQAAEEKIDAEEKCEDVKSITEEIAEDLSAVEDGTKVDAVVAQSVASPIKVEPPTESEPAVEKVETESKTPVTETVPEISDDDDVMIVGKGDPDDDDVMNEKENAVEEECKKQAEALKARFPDLEVSQPLVKVKTADELLFEFKPLVKFENPIKTRWFRDFALEKRISHIIYCIEHMEWPVNKNYSAYTGCQGMDLDVPLYETVKHLPATIDLVGRRSATPDVITITTDQGFSKQLQQAAALPNASASAIQMPLQHSMANLSGAINTGGSGKKRKRHIAIDVETERAKLHALLNSSQGSMPSNPNQQSPMQMKQWQTDDEPKETKRSASLQPPPAHQHQPMARSNASNQQQQATNYSNKPTVIPGTSSTLTPIDLSSR